MASDNLPFEFQQRWPLLGTELFQSLTPAQQDAILDLERRDRDLEDFLANIKTGPSAGVVAELGGNIGGVNGVTPGNQVPVNLGSYTAPSSGATHYYIMLHINATVFSNSLTPIAVAATVVPYFSNIAGPGVQAELAVVATLPDFVTPAGGAAWIKHTMNPGDTVSLDALYSCESSSAGSVNFASQWSAQVTGI